MAVPFSNTTLRVPHGFQGLLEGMVKDILQTQPTDIYSYSAMYFENLLKLREGGSVDPAAKLSEIEDRTYNNKAFKTPADLEHTDAEQEAAIVIQTQYRQYEAKSLTNDLRQQNAAVTIQAGIRGYMTRQRLRASRANQLPREYEKGAVDEEDRELRDIEAEEIQETGKEQELDENELSLYAEQELNEDTSAHSVAAEAEPFTVDESMDLDATEESEPQLFTTNESSDDREMAASEIQAAFRGMKTRKEIKDVKELSAEESGIPYDEDSQLPTVTNEEEETVEQGLTILETSDEPGQLDDGQNDNLLDSAILDELESTEEFIPGGDEVRSEEFKATTNVDEINQDVGETDDGAHAEEQVDEEKPENVGEFNLVEELANQADELDVMMEDTERPTVIAHNGEAEDEAAENVEETNLPDNDITNEGEIEKADTVAEDNDNTNEEELESTAANHQNTDLSDANNLNEEEPEGVIPTADLTIEVDTRQEELLEEAANATEAVLPAEENTNEEEIEKAVSKIQAGLRGMQARHNIALLNESEDVHVYPEVGDDTQEEVLANEAQLEEGGDELAADEPTADAVNEEEATHDVGTDQLPEDDVEVHESEIYEGKDQLPEDDVETHEPENDEGKDQLPEDDVEAHEPENDEGKDQLPEDDVEAHESEIYEGKDQLPEDDVEAHEPESNIEYSATGDNEKLADDDDDLQLQTGRSIEIDEAHQPHDAEVHDDDGNEQADAEEGDN